MDSQKKKSRQLNKNIFWRKIPVIGFLFKKFDLYKTIRKDLTWQHNERDQKELASTTLPEKEKLEIHCSLVSEVFGPSNVDFLIKRLKKLGWDTPENNFNKKEKLTDWIRQGRSSILGNSWINGGIILNYDDKGRFPVSNIRRAKLPIGVDYCYLSLRNITSSLTVVSVLFVFNDQIAKSLKEPYSQIYSTRAKYQPSILNTKRVSFIRPVEQKRQAIQGKLNFIHSNIHKWFKNNLPGFFSASEKNDFPTIDLITSHLYEQTLDEDKKREKHYTDLLFDYSVEVWKCKTDSNLELRLPWHKTEKLNAILFGNFDKLTENNEAYGGKNRAWLVNRLHMDFDNTMSLWTINNLLLNYENQLSAIRDKAILEIKNTKKAIDDLNFIRRQFLPISNDVQAIGNDIAFFAKKKNTYNQDALDFEPPFYYRKNSTYPDFIELLRQQSEIRTKELIKFEKRVNETISASGNLTSAIANLRIQRTVLWFTIFVAIITLVSILNDNRFLNYIYCILNNN